jgi:hypothetical protein
MEGWLSGKFPACFPPTNGGGGDDYASVTDFLRGVDGKFVSRDSNDDDASPVGYDHTCFVMKARYNCASTPNGTTKNKSRAEDYKFVYHHIAHGRDNRRRRWPAMPPCDLDELIGWIGGPTGLGRVLVPPPTVHGNVTNNATNATKYQVVLQGDSRMRQVIEALMCRYMDQITNLTLTFQTPDLSKNAIWLRKKRLKVNNETHILRPNDTGKPRSIGISNESDGFMSYPDVRERGCHGSIADMSRFYHPGVTVPTSVRGCSDDLVMVEFGNIRFYYINRPYLYDDNAILNAYEKLGMTTHTDRGTGDVVLDDIDVLLWSRADGVSQSSLRFLSPERRRVLVSHDWEGVQALMGEIQKRTIGAYFGADNPFIEEIPDPMHACMPGYPDDMVNIMLFSLLGGHDVPRPL